MGLSQGRCVESVLKKAAAEFRFPISQLDLFRSESNCLSHFVSRLDVIELRLK